VRQQIVSNLRQLPSTFRGTSRFRSLWYLFRNDGLLSAGVLQEELEGILENSSLTKWEDDFCRNLVERLEGGQFISSDTRDKAREIIVNYS